MNDSTPLDFLFPDAFASSSYYLYNSSSFCFLLSSFFWRYALISGSVSSYSSCWIEGLIGYWLVPFWITFDSSCCWLYFLSLYACWTFWSSSMILSVISLHFFSDASNNLGYSSTNLLTIFFWTAMPATYGLTRFPSSFLWNEYLSRFLFFSDMTYSVYSLRVSNL